MILKIPTSMVTGLIVMIVGVSVVQAQSRYSQGRLGGYSWGGYGYHSSTAAESRARGMGALIRDRGEGNLLDAMAAGEIEKARSQYIRNTVDATQAYYDRKRIREVYYAKDKKEKREALERYIARRGTIPDLTQNDIDPSTGQIAWPVLLRAEVYKKYRIPYENLAVRYFREGYLSPEEFMQTQRISREWRQQLGKDREKYVVAHVRQAIRFILAIDKQFKGT